MKKFTYVAMALLLTATVAAAAPNQKAHKPAGKTHMVAAEVVSTDAAAKTITVKDEKGVETSLSVEGKAVTELASVKPGEKVELKCMDNGKDGQRMVMGIKAAKAHKMARTPAKPGTK